MNCAVLGRSRPNLGVNRVFVGINSGMDSGSSSCLSPDDFVEHFDTGTTSRSVFVVVRCLGFCLLSIPNLVTSHNEVVVLVVIATFASTQRLTNAQRSLVINNFSLSAASFKFFAIHYINESCKTADATDFEHPTQ